MAIYILPGMGAAAAMYGAPFRKLTGIHYLDWPSYREERTIHDLALRILQERPMGRSDTVGGSSLGGIVAAEIARIVPVEKIILIGSTLMPANISPILKKLSGFADQAPVDLMKTFAGAACALYENQLLQMFSMSNSLFMKTMSQAVFEWTGNPNPPCPVAQIHGAQDRVIYPPETGATIIPDGGHLIALTHAREVAAFVEKHTHT